MKKLLILPYDFPPFVSVGGLRPYAWYKYLKEFDIYPIVVTRQWDNKYGNELDYIAPSKSKDTIIEETQYGTIIKTPYKPNLANKILLKYGRTRFSFIRKLVTVFYELAQFVFFVGTKSGLYYGAKQYLKNNKVDAIIATGEPFILFKYASKLSNTYNIPWIADYRDPWSQSKVRNKYTKKWNSYFEKKYTASTSAIITVSEFVKKNIEILVNNKQFYVIPNGYNSDNFEKLKDIEQNSEYLSLAFVGTIYPWHPLESVLNQFNIFLQHNKNAKIKINFYGINVKQQIEELIETKFLYLKNIITIYPKMSNEKLLKELIHHNIMLLLNDYSFMGTKIYDYLALQRQILFCYSKDKEAELLKQKHYSIQEIEGLSTHLQEDLIKETNSGIVVEDSNHLSKVLVDLYSEFINNGKIACNTCNYERFSRKEQTKALAEIIKNI